MVINRRDLCAYLVVYDRAQEHDIRRNISANKVTSYELPDLGLNPGRSRDFSLYPHCDQPVL
jgi:hypothetical protein